MDRPSHPGEPPSLEARLRRALEAELDGPVDVRPLLDGARAGAARIRRRRTMVAAGLAAVVVAGVPLGLAALPGQDGGLPAATSTSTLQTPATPDSSTAMVVPPTGQTTRPVPPPETAPSLPAESPVNPGVPEGLAGSVSIPDAALLAPGDLGFVPQVTDDFGHYLKVRTLTTSLCGDGEEPGDDQAIGGRSLSYTGPANASVSTVVRVFEGTGATEQMSHLRESMPVCSYAQVFEPQPVAGLPGDEAVLGVADDGIETGFTYVVGALRLGNVTVGVGANLEGEPSTVLPEARRLLTLAGERVEASGLPAAHPQ